MGTAQRHVNMCTDSHRNWDTEDHNGGGVATPCSGKVAPREQLGKLGIQGPLGRPSAPEEGPHRLTSPGAVILVSPSRGTARKTQYQSKRAGAGFESTRRCPANPVRNRAPSTPEPESTETAMERAHPQLVCARICADGSLWTLGSDHPRTDQIPSVRPTLTTLVAPDPDQPTTASVLLKTWKTAARHQLSP